MLEAPLGDLLQGSEVDALGSGNVHVILRGTAIVIEMLDDNYFRTLTALVKLLAESVANLEPDVYRRGGNCQMGSSAQP